ncbi:hypothetical protein [Pendulispora albinea]|uniref:Uncharacterized protein n=1 Tax=Pendulispora albinea TaxID=2741071 RepID=A0ABZ2M0N3_9BACT
MARNVSLAELRQRVRWRIDEENATRRTPDTELNVAINEGIASYHTELVRCRGQGFGEEQATITTVAGQTTYPLPTRWLSVVKVWTMDGGVECVLRTFEEFETDGLSDAVSGDVESSYRVQADTIAFRPAPTAQQVFFVRFIGAAVKLVADTDKVDGINGLEEYIVAWAGRVIAIKNRDWELRDTLTGMMAEKLDQMRALEAMRTTAEPPRMSDVRRDTWCRSRRFGR